MSAFSFLSNAYYRYIVLFVVYLSLPVLEWCLYCVKRLNIICCVLLYNNYIS